MKNPYVLAVAVAVLVLVAAVFAYQSMNAGGQTAMERDQVKRRMQEYMSSTQKRGNPSQQQAPSGPGTPPGPGR